VGAGAPAPARARRCAGARAARQAAQIWRGSGAPAAAPGAPPTTGPALPGPAPGARRRWRRRRPGTAPPGAAPARRAGPRPGAQPGTRGPAPPAPRGRRRGGRSWPPSAGACARVRRGRSTFSTPSPRACRKRVSPAPCGRPNLHSPPFLSRSRSTRSTSAGERAVGGAVRDRPRPHLRPRGHPQLGEEVLHVAHPGRRGFQGSGARDAAPLVGGYCGRGGAGGGAGGRSAAPTSHSLSTVRGPLGSSGVSLHAAARSRYTAPTGRSLRSRS